MSPKNQVELPSLKVHQWLPQWNDVKFIDKKLRRKPEPFFYIFSIRADWLRKLSDIYRRQATGGRAEDPSIQRTHRNDRSNEIANFIEGGFPWSDLTPNQRKSNEFKDLKMPGWLSTSIIANILAPNTKRLGKSINKQDLVTIKSEENGFSSIALPDNFERNNWQPDVKPIEIIDGQHRLLALDDKKSFGKNYELPVVAFYNLDITWQAYLFYTINIKPKRINASLAFDLYPLLRIQDWLEASPTRAQVYKDTRAQELTEILWSYPESPWHQRINMLGDSNSGTVTQASFIRSLTATFIKRWEGSKIGGLFGAELETDTNDVLQWSRTQQAAFLVLMWQYIAKETASSEEEWATSLKALNKQAHLPGLGKSKPSDFVFTSKYSLLAGDQGVRGILHVINDMCYISADKLKLTNWSWQEELSEDGIKNESVSSAIKSLKKQPVNNFLEDIAKEIMSFEWRNASFPNLDRVISKNQMIYRGAGGYKQLRMELLETLKKSKDQTIKQTATKVLQTLF